VTGVTRYLCFDGSDAAIQLVSHNFSMMPTSVVGLAVSVSAAANLKIGKLYSSIGDRVCA